MNTNKKNYQKSSIRKRKCPMCDKKCNIVYDKHHDEHYSLTCGLVIIRNNQYQIPLKIEIPYKSKRKKNI